MFFSSLATRSRKHMQIFLTPSLRFVVVLEWAVVRFLGCTVRYPRRHFPYYSWRFSKQTAHAAYKSNWFSSADIWLGFGYYSSAYVYRVWTALFWFFAIVIEVECWPAAKTKMENILLEDWSPLILFGKQNCRNWIFCSSRGNELPQEGKNVFPIHCRGLMRIKCTSLL